MAKGKNLNPADAHRKALRKKELKKNKVERQKNRDFALVKKDTSEIEEEIVELEKLAESTAIQKARITELKSELSRINKKKEDYVEEHPEQRGLVYRRRTAREEDRDDAKAQPPGKTKRNIFNKNGLPRHPERSVYYDPVMNPYGMPPPGMPYVERALLPGEVDSDAEEEAGESDGSEDDIAMPEGPPPGAKDDELDDDDSDDDIPMPEGLPPTDLGNGSSSSLPPLPPGPPPLPSGPPPAMPPFAPNLPPNIISQMFPVPPPFPPPPTMTPIGAPPFPPHGMPPPPPGFYHNSLPPPPPGFYPRRAQSTSAVQDPLSAIPHQTYQAHRQTRQVPPPPSLPHNPNLPPRPPALGAGPSVGSSEASSVNATVSAAPQLRDFKKESTAFMPAALKRKKAGGGAASGRVNAAPALGTDAGDADGDAGAEEGARQQKPDLLGTLKEKFGPMAGSASHPTSSEFEGGTKRRKVEDVKERPKDDYDNFLAEMGDMLGPTH
ncbi:hypothetical protein M0805_002530 [Coniferiporia weirii]|nr:hypothetical protein M0805_002530 [Coniferiporia weirii]